MKKALLFFVSLLFLGTVAKAQVLADFTDGKLDGFVSNAGGSDSIYVTADPAGVLTHVMGWHMTLTSSNNAQMQTDNISIGAAQLLTYWIYIPTSANIPDTTVIGLWAMDHQHWNWQEIDTKAKAIPKDKWYPLSMPLTQLNLKAPGNFDPIANQIRIGMQIYGAPWSGKFYISNISLIGANPTNLYPANVSFLNLNTGWTNGWIKNVAQVSGLIGGKTNPVMYQIKDTVIRVIDTIKSKVTGLDSLIDTTYTRPTGTAFMGDVADGGNFDFSNQNFLVAWIWADTTLPDSAQIYIYAQDRSHWGDPAPLTAPINYGINIPKKVWYPIYMDLSAMNVVDTGTFNAAKNKLGWFGIDFGARVDTLVKSGTIYVYHIDVLNNIVNPPPVWVAADFENAGKNGKQGFYVPSYASGTLKRYADLVTSDQSYVLQGTVNISSAAPKFAAVRDTIPMESAADTTATSITFGLYLPAKFPSHALVNFFVSGGTGDSISIVDTVGGSLVKAGQWSTLTIPKLDSLATIGKFDPSKPAQVGVVIWYPAPYDTTKFAGNVEFDNLTINGVRFSSEILDGVKNNNSVVKVYKLYNNYPNPFNPTTMIQYDLAKDSKVLVQVYDVLGRLVTTLVNNEHQVAGTHQIEFNASKLASGMYFYRLVAGSYSSTQRMMLIK